MNENELYEVLSSYKQALDTLINKVEELENENAALRSEVTERIDGMEKTLFDDILNPAKEAMDKAAYDNRYDDFNSKYGEKLDPLVESTKAIEGDDYDLKREVFDNYDKMEDKPDEDTYVDTVVESVTKQIETLKSVLGADNVEIKSDEDDKVTIEADGKDVTEEGEEILKNEDGIVHDEREEEIASPEEIEELEKELSAYK